MLTEGAKSAGRMYDSFSFINRVVESIVRLVVDRLGWNGHSKEIYQ